MLSFSLEYLLRYKRWLIVLSICSILTTFIGLAVPFFTALFIDTILVGKNVTYLRPFVLLFCFIIIFEVASNYYSSIYSAKIHAEAAFQMNRDVLNHVQRLPFAFFQKTDSAYLAQRIDNDVNSIVAFALGNVINIFVSAFTFLAASILLFLISPMWLFLFWGAIVVYGTIYLLFRRSLRKWSYLSKEVHNEYFSHLTEQFRYIKTIKIHVLYQEFLSILKNSFASFLDILISRSKLSFWFSSSGKITQRLFVLCVFLIGGAQVIKGDLSIGNFVAINSYFSIALGSISFFLGLGQSFQETGVAFQRIRDLMDQQLESEGAEIFEDIEHICVEDLCLSQEDKEILKNFSHEFFKGNVYCIIGDNGAGKTSLLYMLIGLITPTSGHIKYDGVDMREINKTVFRRRNVAFLEQESVLIKSSLTKNMLLGHENADSLETWITKYDMQDFVFTRDDIGFVVDDHLSVLSGGEKQKISQIRAFAKNAPLIFLDEPISALDERGVGILANVIQEIKREKIVIITTNQTAILRIADEIIKI